MSRDTTSNDLNRAEALSLFQSVFDEIKQCTDVYSIGQTICERLINEFRADGCEIKILDDEGTFCRIHFARRGVNRPDDQLLIESKFKDAKSTLGNSLFGYCLTQNSSFEWLATENETFTDFVKSTNLPINKRSAEIYAELMPTGQVSNFLVIPFHMHPGEKRSLSYQLKGCLDLLNIYDGTSSHAEMSKAKARIMAFFEIVSVHIFHALFFERAENEIQIDRTIKKFTAESDGIESFLDKIVSHFADQLKSPLSTIWFHDSNYHVLGMHSVYINRTHLPHPELLESEIFRVIEADAPHMLKVSDSLIGNLVSDQNEKFLKIADVYKEPLYKWTVVNDIIGTRQFVALPLRDRGQIVAVIIMNVNMTEDEFERIPISYFTSFASQISITLKFFMERSFSDNARVLSEKLKSIIRKKPEAFYDQLVQKIKDVVGAEACSIFEVKKLGTKETGIYLIATTDKSAENQKRLNTKIFDIDSKSITGHVAVKNEPLIIFDVSRVTEFYDGIEGRSNAFLEATQSGFHRSYIAVPIIPDIAEEAAQRSTLIIRCINKEKKHKNQHTEIFSEYDKDLLYYVGTVSETFRRVFEVLKERNDLIDLVIHEIENPIASIRAKLDSIYNKENKAVLVPRDLLVQKLDDIELMNTLLKKWVNNMDILNQLMQGKRLLASRKTVNLWYDVIQNVIHWLKPDLSNNRIRPSDIQIRNLDDKLWIQVDEDHFRQVFYNLILNALKYKLRETAPKIEIEFQTTLSGVSVFVKDFGVGMDPEAEARIFERGYRSPYAVKKNIKGKGFGLWLCRELLRSNDCDIILALPRNPTSFEIKIPKRHLTNRP